jgi:hypothetical protein
VAKPTGSAAFAPGVALPWHHRPSSALIWIGTDGSLIRSATTVRRGQRDTTAVRHGAHTAMRLAFRRESGLRLGGSPQLDDFNHLPHARHGQDLAEITRGLPAGVYVTSSRGPGAARCCLPAQARIVRVVR